MDGRRRRRRPRPPFRPDTGADARADTAQSGLPAVADHQAPPGAAVRFVLEVMREAGGQADPPDQRVLSSLVGQPITYSSGVRLPSVPGQAGEPGGDRLVGLSLTLDAEQVQGNLVSVRLELSGAEFTDAQRTHLEPFRHESIHTVSSVTSFEVALSVPPEPTAAPAAGAATATVRYLVRVTPVVGP